MTALIDRVPALLGRARALLGLPPGPPDRLAPSELRRAAQAASALHEGLVGRRALAHRRTYDDAAHLGAYLLWWWPQTYAKVQAVLALARSAGTLPAIPARPRTLDVGAGPAPAALAQLAAELGLRADEALAYAPLVLVRSVPPPPRDVWRVVGVPRPEKGKKRLFVCSDQGRVPVGRLDRDAVPTNADFDRLERGDLVLLGGVARKGDGLRVGRESEVRLLEGGERAQTPTPSLEPG